MVCRHYAESRLYPFRARRNDARSQQFAKFEFERAAIEPKADLFAVVC